MWWMPSRRTHESPSNSTHPSPSQYTVAVPAPKEDSEQDVDADAVDLVVWVVLMAVLRWGFWVTTLGTIASLAGLLIWWLARN